MFIHFLIFYGSYLCFPFAFLCLYLLVKNKRRKTNTKLSVGLIFLLILTGLFIYARFIERYSVRIQETTLSASFDADIVVFSDIHLGIYKGEDFLKKIVSKIHSIPSADAVLIAGDFTYYPEEDLASLTNLFSPLRDIRFPVYAVLGNHDTENPGPPLRNMLSLALEKNGVRLLQNQSLVMKDTDITLLGLGDSWGNEDDVSSIDNFSEEDNLIVLTHNPDTTLKYTNALADITIAGHTHGGQIRIPFLYKNIIPCEGSFDYGVYEQETGTVFVTAGVGEVGLPMRLGIPPTIEVLHVRQET